MPITETDALGLHQAISSGLLDEERQKAAALKLQGYADERKRQGLSLFPSVEKQRREQRQRFYSVIEDPKKLDAENGIYQRADAVRPGGGDNMRAEEVTARWMAEKYQLPVDEVRKDWKKYAQDYGARNWNEAVVLEAPRFLARVQQEAKAEKLTVDTISTAADEAMKSALRGGDMVADWKAWEAANPEAPKGARKAWEQVQGETLKRLGPDGRAAAMRAVRALQNATGTAENADGWWNEAKRDLVAIKAASPGKYRMVLEAIKLLGSEGPKDDKGLAQGVGESFARSVEHITRGSMSSLEPFQARLAEAGITNADDPQALANHIRAGLDVDKDMLDLANGAIDPITPDGWLESGVYMTAGSLPYMLAAFNPLGHVAMAGSFSNEAYHDLKASGWEGAGAEVAAVASGTIQAVVEGLSEVVAKIPGVGAVLAKYGVKPGTNWVSKFLVRSGVRAGAEFTEEVIQQATTPFIRDLAGAILPNVPETPKGQKLKDVMAEFFKADNSVPLLLSVLPLGMIGAGMRTAQDKAIVDWVTSSREMLESVYSPADAAAIAAEPDARKREALMHDKWVDMPTEELVKRAAAQQEKIRKQNADAWRAVTRAEQMGMIPVVRRGQNGWTVTQGGKTLQVQSRQEAVELAYSGLSDLEFQSAASMAQVADEFANLGGGRAEAFEISMSQRSVQQEVDVGRVTPEQAAESVQVFAQMHGLTAEEARAETLSVLGNNKSEMVEGVRTAISRIFGGGNLVTVLHEGVHGRWRQGLESGHYTPQQGLAWVRMAEQATGVDFLATKDDSQVSALMLDEAITEVASANIVGKRKDQKQHFTPGLISRGIAAFALDQRNSALGSSAEERAKAREAGKFSTFLKAWKEFWGLVLRNARKLKKARAEGKLGEDFDAFLDDLLGADAQQRHEGAAAKEAVDLVDTSPFSLAPKKVSGDFFQRPGVFYRVIVGDDAFQDILQSGEVRTNAGSKTTAGASLAEKLAARPTAFPSFSKDSASMSYAQANPNHFIIVTTDSSIQPSTAGRHSAGKTHFPTDAQGNHLKSLSASKVSVYRHIGNDQYRLIYDKGNAVSTTSGVDNAPFSLGGVSFSLSSPDMLRRIAAIEGDETTAGAIGLDESYHASRDSTINPDAASPRDTRQGKGKAGFYTAPIESETEQYQRQGSKFVHRFDIPAETRIKLLRRAGQIERLTPDQVVDWRAQGFGAVIGKAIIGQKAEVVLLNPQKSGDNAPFSLVQSRATPADTSNVVEMPDGAQMVGPTLFSITAYHGTPHKVDKFTTAKIGTGEGAQAYGWGLYFAAARAIAEYYQKALTDNTLYFNGKPLLKNGVMIGSLGDAELDDWFYHGSESYDPEESAQSAESDGRPDIAAKIRALIPNITKGEPGNLYTVELLPNEEDFLDWDKPLSEQSEKVKAALKAYPLSPASKGVDIYHDIDGVALSIDDLLGDTNGAKTRSQLFASLGIPGIKYLDGNSRDGGTGTSNFVIFDESLVKILEENGRRVDSAVFSLAPSSQVSAKTDAEYMAAVESGDTETAQRLVDEAAKAAGYNVGPVWHGTVADFTSFDNKKTGKNDAGLWGRGHYFANSYDRAESYARRQGDNAKIIAAFVSLKNPLILTTGNDLIIRLPDGTNTRDLIGQNLDGSKIKAIAVDGGHDGVIQIKPNGEIGDLVVYSPKQIKSADPVTYDSAGNVIPLSQRFNEQFDDIRYSLAPRSLASVADTVLASRMKSPEFRDKFYTIAREKLSAFRRDGDWRVDKWGNASRKTGADSFADRTRTVANIERERKFRQRSRQRELIEQGMNGLTNETRLAYETDLMALEDQPLIASMLNDHGRLMSWKTANEQGRIDGFSGDYDGAPWLPPAWYAKGSGIMPDVMAQYLYDDGHLSEPTTDALWSALSAAIEGVRLQNAEVKKATAAVREIERDALRKSKEEADAWAKVEKDRIPTPKERQMMALRTLDALLSAFPPEIRGRVGGFVQLAALGTDKAREAEIERRIGKLDEVVESEAKKHYGAEVAKLFERAKPKRKAGEKPKGKLGADVHAMFDRLKAAMSMTDIEADGRADILEAQVASGDLTPEEEAIAIREAGLTRLLGNWYPRTRPTGRVNVKGHPIVETIDSGADAARMGAAYDALQELLSGAMADSVLQKRAQAEKRQAIREALIQSAGSHGDASFRDAKTIEVQRLGGWFKELSIGGLNFGQALEWAFGDSVEVRALADWERRASNQKEDAIQEAAQAVEDLFTAMAGGRYKGEKLRWALGQKNVKVGTRTLSQLEMLKATMMWMQEDGRRDMEGFLDEAGNPIGPWHYSQAFVDEIEGKLSKEAKTLRSFLLTRYADGWAGLDAVYSRLNGVHLPQHANYSPLTKAPQQAPAGMGIDPVTSSVTSGKSTSPGGLKSRSGKIAEPIFSDALQTFMAHTRQMEHWKAYAELVNEARSALANREVGNAIEGATNAQARSVLQGWVDFFAEGGTRDAAAYLALVRGISKASGRGAMALLVGKIGTLAVQATQLAGAAAKIPFTSYVKRLSKLMTGNLGWRAAMRSAYIQRRLLEMPPIVRQAMEGLSASKPNRIKYEVARIGRWISGADALFTAGTFAILYDYHVGQAYAMGLRGADAVRYAETEAERATDEVAQPTRAGARSLVENRATTPFMRLAWAFASESRKNLGLMLAAAKPGMTKPRFARAVLFATVLNSGIAWLIRSAWRDDRDPSDDELFDEDHWSAKRLALGIGTDWLQGIPVFGQVVQGAVYKAAGEYQPEGNLFSAVSRSLPSWEKMLSGESEDTLKDIDLILSGLAPFNDTISAASSMSHLARDLKDVSVNFVSE